MDLLVKIESGNLLSIKRDVQYITYITDMIAKNLHVSIEEYYLTMLILDKNNPAQSL